MILYYNLLFYSSFRPVFDVSVYLGKFWFLLSQVLGRILKTETKSFQIKSLIRSGVVVT